jgi:hypothetical protein
MTSFIEAMDLTKRQGIKYGSRETGYLTLFFSDPVL